MIYSCAVCKEPVSDDIAPVLENGTVLICATCSSFNLVTRSKNELLRAYAINEHTTLNEVMLIDQHRAHELELQFIEIKGE